MARKGTTQAHGAACKADDMHTGLQSFLLSLHDAGVHVRTCCRPCLLEPPPAQPTVATLALSRAPCRSQHRVWQLPCPLLRSG